MAKKIGYWLFTMVMVCASGLSYYGGYTMLSNMFGLVLLVMALPDTFQLWVKRKFHRVVTYLLWYRRYKEGE